MLPHNKTLHSIASELGLGDEDKVLCKAAEFQHLLQTKLTAENSISDTEKIVICLDLAASLFEADLDAETVIKYSGVELSVYKYNKNTVKNLLEFNNSKLTVSMLCVTLQCEEVKDLAEKILDDYYTQAEMKIDLNMPQYVCMAVLQACRLSKVKVSEAEIIEKSRLKPAEWSELEAEWTKLAEADFGRVKNKMKTEAVDGESAEPIDVDPIKPQSEEAVDEAEDIPYRLSKVKISEAEIIEKSGLNSAQRLEFEADWTEFDEVDLGNAKKKRKIETVDGLTEEMKINWIYFYCDVDPIKPQLEEEEGGGNEDEEGRGNEDEVQGGGNEDEVEGAGNEDEEEGGGNEDEEGRGNEGEVQGGGNEDEVEGGGNEDEVQGGGNEDEVEGAGNEDKEEGGGNEDEEGRGNEGEVQGGGNEDEVEGGGNEDEEEGGGNEDEEEGGGNEDEEGAGEEDQGVREEDEAVGEEKAEYGEIEKEEEEEIEEEEENVQSEPQIEPEIEPYSVWRERMLKQAYAELREFEKNQRTKNE